MFIRTLFIVLRFLGYGAVFFALVWNHLDQYWWQWLIGTFVWILGTLEHWKRPDETSRLMRRGIWLEAVLIVVWTFAVHDNLVLVLLVSPVARAGVHLGWRDSAVLTASSAVCVLAPWPLWSTALWFSCLEFVVILGAAGYSLVLGQLMRQRDKLRRAVQVTAFEREQRVKDEERLRLAGQLHDTTGQYWTAVIRALDVVEQVTGNQQRMFIEKARGAAMDGLSAMREVTHAWNAGRQTPRAWLQYAEDSLQRLQNVVGIDIQFQSVDIEWMRFVDRVQIAELFARTMIEGATNAIRHGDARRLAVVLQSGAREVRLVIRDDGNDLATGQNSAQDGMGISALQSLAEEEGGTLHLESTGRGARLILSIPYAW